jgi:uncharacterized LabA/DUF88 family protein
MKNEDQKTYAFVDSQNLNLDVRDSGWKLDFLRFGQYLKDKFKVDKTYLFIGYVAGNESLYTALQQAGFIVIFKPTLEYKKGAKKEVKGNVDAELVLHCMIQLRSYTKAIIVSGDGDFHCLVEFLEKRKKLDRLIIPNSNRYSSLLRKFRKYHVYMNGLRKKLEKKKRGSNLRTEP